MNSPTPPAHTPTLDRRGFLRSSAGAGVVASLPAWAGRALAAGEDDLVTISILHTTDLHGHILPTETYDGMASRRTRQNGHPDPKMAEGPPQ